MTLEKKEARAEKDEAEKYQKFQQELVRRTVTLIYMYNHVYTCNMCNKKGKQIPDV